MESVKSKIGMIGGKVGNFLEKAIDHPMRNLCKIGLLK
jgi:hypothetical protein